MSSQSLFSMLDQDLKSKSTVSTDSRFVEFNVEAEPVCAVLGAILFEQLRAGCGGQARELNSIVLAADPAMLWSHVQDGLGKIMHCCRGGGLKVQIGYEPGRTFFDMRRQALYAMAEHLTELN